MANLTRRTARRLARPSPDAPRDVASALRDINWPRLRAWHAQIDRPDVDRLMHASVEELRNYASTGFMTTPSRLIGTLDRIDKLTANVCVPIEALSLGQDGGFVETKPSPAGFGTSPNGETFADYARLSLLPVVVASLAVILKISHMLLKFYHTRRYSRRSCRVKAELHIGAYVIQGRVTVLGLHGCRFSFVDDDGRALLSVVAESGETHLQIGSIRLPSDTVSLTDNWAAIRFHEALPQKLHTTILERSEERTRMITLPRLTYNVSAKPSEQTESAAPRAGTRSGPALAAQTAAPRTAGSDLSKSGASETGDKDNRALTEGLRQPGRKSSAA